MKIEFDKKKGAEALSGLVQNTVVLGKKAVAGAKAGVATVMEKVKTDEHARRLKKYNPVFPDQYHHADFHLPNIVVIVDDAVRRNVDVCQGAIGWLDNQDGTEIFYLYDEAVNSSGIKFVPSRWICNTIYVADPFDRRRFILAEQLDEITLKEKMDELHLIAESIGVKRCVIEIAEASRDANAQQLAIDAAVKNTGAVAANFEHSSTDGSHRRFRIESEFRGLRFPKRPSLKYFKNDEKIERLVQTCCTGRRRVKSETLELSVTATATVSHSVACAIGAIIGRVINIQGGASLGEQTAHEHLHTLLFHIEF